MRKFFFVFFLFPILTATAQHWPGLSDQPVWRVDFSSWTWPNCAFSGTAASYQYTYSGDTIINGHVYHEVQKTGYILNSMCYYPVQPFGYCGAVRQDSSDNKIYIVLADSSSESLLYDFNLNPDDTLHSVLETLYPGCGNPVVDSVDTVTISSQPRRRLFLRPSCMGTEIIEGIGNIQGLIEQIGSFESSGILLCYNDAQINYTNPQYTTSSWGCYLPSPSSDPPQPLLTLQPNLAADVVHLQFSGRIENVSITITDITGRILCNEPFRETVSVRDFSPGIYLLSLKGQGLQAVTHFIRE